MVSGCWETIEMYGGREGKCTICVARKQKRKALFSHHRNGNKLVVAWALVLTQDILAQL